MDQRILTEVGKSHTSYNQAARHVTYDNTKMATTPTSLHDKLVLKYFKWDTFLHSCDIYCFLHLTTFTLRTHNCLPILVTFTLILEFSLYFPSYRAYF